MIRIRATGEFRGIEQAHRIFADSLQRGLQGLGRLVQRSIRIRTRYFAGHERRSVTFTVSGSGLNKNVVWYSELVQTIIDELGLPAGTFPPWGVGSRLFNYVRRKGLHRVTDRREHHNFNVRRRPRKVSHLASRSPQRRAIVAAKAKAKRARRRGAARPKGKPPTQTEKRVRRVAFLMARSIFERGIKPTKPFSEGLNANANRIMQEIRSALARAVTRINRGGE